MIAWMGAGFLVVGFVVLTQWFGLVEKSKNVISITRRSLDVIRSSSLSDDEKETALQSDAKQLFRLFIILTFGATAAVLLPMGLVWICDRLGLVSLSSILDVAFSPAFLITSGILAVLALYLGSRSKGKTTGYSMPDRILHRVAFKTYTAQVSLADIEDQVFAKQLALCKIDRPVFITALPRAGTTLLLECCASVQEFASHCYRDMPFVLIPCLWNRFSATFRQTGESRQRAHGDGMLINFDSPEALEEVLWKTFWRRHYPKDRVIPWQDEDNDEFDDFFRNHMRKIILLRRGKDAAAARYVSKNNLNIARAAMLRRIFPDSVIVVPFRDPLQHASSLLEQHRNFLHIHKEDRFASQYMRAIGHYDFGENLRPIDFGGWLDNRMSSDTGCLTFWLEYWVVSYRRLLTQNPDILCFLDYDALCNSPERGLRLLAHAIGSRDYDALLSTANKIRGPRPREIDANAVPASLIQEADRVYARLREAALT
jgi:hypothetical protein